MNKYLENKIKHFDPKGVKSFNNFFEQLENCAFQGRNLGTALRIMNKMYSDNDCLRVLTLSGALVPAGMSRIIERLIEVGYVHVIVSTGANIIHDLVNSCVCQGHYLGFSDADDDELCQEKINRIYDVFLPEENYMKTEKHVYGIIKKIIEKDFNGNKNNTILPSRLFNLIGRELSNEGRDGVLATAAKHNVKVYCGATSDSEFALDLAKYRVYYNINFILDEISDVQDFGDMILSKTRRGTLVLGGGVPRNWAQQIFPYLEQVKNRDAEVKKFEGYNYGIRICPESANWGGLSGCTFSESKSWGKYGPNARMCEIAADATIAFPLLATAFLEGIENKS